ncbi:Asp-tRNA(Asn)/Glu-tRNA(Gln) amidotransferase subunit GatA [Salsipaludibacter albus]|uniref:Asp-tRNA(Asn)/Glu-tRNA(Gln) amidotransferase subunit GatA n=1 Tax=Salsipaludibacter albus TaxID=2849650 RepID=UPI001EE3D94F|nr:Asp-tRNA(Asn)/Glu-tRNA(Gln) amidotransferase subunit GatA [Salsipaludibacter albus]MBY5163675.1 Asp-tRNA(Asn)/Glu-tRNA(Gln) amidotransferase subunit GatA [Salsipaludibacter albus]
MTSDLLTDTAAGLAARMAAREVSAREVVDAHLDRIEATDGDGTSDTDVHAFLTVVADTARRHADDVDQRRVTGRDLGPLAGVPLALKDLFTMRGAPTTVGSRILEGWVPPYDATVTEKLRAADVIVLGKTNMDEFAMGSSTENSAYGPTRNPWDLGRVPGGSSGGSAAAVAALQAPLSLGTDTGGSIRQPAALCGLVGSKPTYGAVSRYGMVAFASSLDQAGPFARSVTDAALLQSVIQGHDPRDSTSIDPVRVGRDLPDLLADLDAGVEGLTIGVVTELQGEGYEPGVLAAFEDSLRRFEALGATVVEASIPHASYGLPAYYLVAPSEASSNLARFDGVRYGLRVDAPTAEEMNAATRGAGFGPEVRRRIMIGTHALSSGYYDAFYNQASRVRRLIANDFATAFEQVDVLVSPTSPSVAFPLGDKTDDPLAMYLNDVATVPASLAGVPAVSVPNGRGAEGLPTGLQVMGPLLGDDRCFRVARALEADLGLDPVPSGANAVAPA